MRKSEAVRQLWLAMVLLTRLPLPHLPTDAFAAGARAVWAYPLVGLIVGGAGALIAGTATAFGLPAAVAALLALGAMMLATGGMHEDGLADLCDGFWGAVHPARRLEIMRDSQIGTYGVLGLIVTTGLRWSALTVLLPTGPAPLIAAAVLSRAVMPVPMATLPHARDDGLARSVGRPRRSRAAAAFGIGAVVAGVALGWTGVVAALLALSVAGATGALARRRIGGQTGDVLGAVQQISEVAVLLVCLALV